MKSRLIDKTAGFPVQMIENVQVSIRKANATDANLLADLGSRTFQETFSGDNTPEDMATYLTSSFSVERQIADLADPAWTALIAEVDGVGAGYAKLRSGSPATTVVGAKPVELVRLYVLHEWLGRGVGEKLMRACLNEARSAGYETIWLGVWERNARAQAFYRKWNFRPVGEQIFQLGSDPQRDIVMERGI